MEYALLVALIAVVCIAAVTFLGSSASGKFDKAGNGIGGRTMVSCQNLFTIASHVEYYSDGTNSGLLPDECP